MIGISTPRTCGMQYDMSQVVSVNPYTLTVSMLNRLINIMRPYRPIRTTVLLTQAHCQLTASPPATEYITKWQVFKALERRRRTATELDALPSPSWFLKLGALVFSKPLAQLFNLSIATSEVPSQWKQAYIRPVGLPKVAHPVFLVWPISITPVLTRTMERFIITYSNTSKFSDHMPSGHLGLQQQL